MYVSVCLIQMYVLYIRILSTDVDDSVQHNVYIYIYIGCCRHEFKLCDCQITFLCLGTGFRCAFLASSSPESAPWIHAAKTAAGPPSMSVSRIIVISQREARTVEKPPKIDDPVIRFVFSTSRSLIERDLLGLGGFD